MRCSAYEARVSLQYLSWCFCRGIYSGRCFLWPNGTSKYKYCTANFLSYLINFCSTVPLVLRLDSFACGHLSLGLTSTGWSILPCHLRTLVVFSIPSHCWVHWCYFTSRLKLGFLWHYPLHQGMLVGLANSSFQIRCGVTSLLFLSPKRNHESIPRLLGH